MLRPPLAIKAASGKATINHLCAQLQMRQPAVSGLVKRAERAGLVSRAHSEIDRRVVLVNLTREGEKRLRRGFDALRGDRATLAEALGLLMTKLEVMTKLEAQPLGRR